MDKQDENIINEAEARKQVLHALMEKPTTYKIDVEVGSMLPKDLKDSKEIEMIIKPPTLHVMTLAGLEANKIPEEILNIKEFSLQKALPYVDEVIRILCIMVYQDDEYPEWWEEFFKKNCTPDEIFKMLQECHVKMRSDFFLNSFQIIGTNPMMMTKPKKKKKKN